MQGADWPTRIRTIIDAFEDGNQSAFAKRLGLTKQGVSKLLGGSTPSGATLEELVRSYPSVDLEYLLTGRGPVRSDVPRTGAAFERGAAEVVGELEGFVRALRERHGAATQPDADAERFAPGEAEANLPPPAVQAPSKSGRRRKAAGDGPRT